MQLMTTSEIYAVGVPIILMMIGLEVIFSVYKKRDCTALVIQEELLDYWWAISLFPCRPKV